MNTQKVLAEWKSSDVAQNEQMFRTLLQFAIHLQDCDGCYIEEDGDLQTGCAIGSALKGYFGEPTAEIEIMNCAPRKPCRNCGQSFHQPPCCRGTRMGPHAWITQCPACGHVVERE